MRVKAAVNIYDGQLDASPPRPDTGDRMIGWGRRAGLWCDTHSRLLAHQSCVPHASLPQRLPHSEIKLFLLIGKSHTG